MVWFRWTATATPADIDSALAALRAMQPQIPGLLEVSCGANLTSRTPFTHALLVKMEGGLPELAIYDAHPAHQAVVQTHIKPILAEVTALDYVTA